jgi:F-type H+-transporting ATPase subunit delta
MVYRRIARRYAVALFASAVEQGVMDAVERDLESAHAVVAANAKLRAVLRHPEISTQRKQEIVQSVFAALQPISVTFLSLLVERRRQDYLDQALEEYRRLADQARGLVRAQVVSAVALTGEQQQRLSGALERRTGKRVLASYAVDPGLLAGLVVNIADSVVDASARGRLERMRELLAAARYRGLGG